MAVASSLGLIARATAATRVGSASLSPFAGRADSQDPPESVDDFTLQRICPRPVFKIWKNCGVVGPPPSTAKNVNPVCGRSMVCWTAETVIFTGAITLCAGLALAAVTRPEYTPGARPVGSAVMFTGNEAKALSAAM